LFYNEGKPCSSFREEIKYMFAFEKDHGFLNNSSIEVKLKNAVKKLDSN